MNASGQIVCLNMIVKNEAPVVRRCIDSVRPIIDYWVIVDTGSIDGTQDIIRQQLSDLPGELHERPWRDFAHNRSEALELARGRSDYTLIIDADNSLEIGSDRTLPALTADSYPIEIRDASIVYQRTQLVRSALPWRYEGVLHEYLTCEGAGLAGELSGIWMRRNHDGARRKDPADLSAGRRCPRGGFAGRDKTVPARALPILPGAKLSRRRRVEQGIGALLGPS